MNIYTLRDNLRNTIAGKERLVAHYLEIQDNQLKPGDYRWNIHTTLSALVQIEVDGLKKILADVEVCCKQATADSWALNPDRSGGQFTEDEINNANRWN